MALRIVKKPIDAARRFFGELRRRKVVKVAGVYAVVAWLVIQIAANTFPALHLPDWATTLVIVLMILGFPIAIVLSWAFDLTAAGSSPERSTVAASSPPARPARSSHLMSRSGPVSAHLARPAVHSPLPAEEDAPAADPDRARRAVIASLRHDLRTPMNAVLGYGGVLVIEAEELGIAALVPDIQRLHGAAKKLLDQIDHLLPSGPDAANIDVDLIRGRLHDALLAPTAALVEQSQQLLANAGNSERASTDLERQLGAARKLLALVQQLALPAAPASESAVRAGFERVFSRLRPTPGTTTGSLHAGTLLVVDDNAINRDLLTRQLVREGYSVFTAASGKEALEKLRLHDFDLVLLDVMMPEMDGIQVLERIQSDPVLRDIPAVMISALDEIDSVARCIEKGAVDYFAKPFDPVLLRARVSAPLQIHQLRQDLRRAEEALTQNRTTIDELIRSVVPRVLAEGFGQGERTVSAHYAEVTAVVARLEGLDAIAARRGAGETIARVSEILGAFEACTRAQGLDIVRATDRCYTAIVGAPEWREDHAQVAADYALSLLQAIEARAHEAQDFPEIRIGLNTGALIAGVAGGDRLVFGMWGDAVSTADAIACQAPAGKIQVTAATCAKLSHEFDVRSATDVEVRGHGHLRTYVLVGRKPSIAVPVKA
ncbi:MAG: response regulator [Burkholderiales bacterium]